MSYNAVYSIGVTTGEGDTLSHDRSTNFCILLWSHICFVSSTVSCGGKISIERLRFVYRWRYSFSTFVGWWHNQLYTCFQRSSEVFETRGDHLLERFVFLWDTGWLNEETHKFYVEEKAVFKIQVKGEFAELNEICGKKSRKWSKDFSRELQSSLDYFENFLRSKLHHLSDYSGINFHIAISLLFEIANNKKNNLSFSRQSVVRAINVALKIKKEEDDSDLIKLFNGDQEAKTSSFMLIMWSAVFILRT